MDMSVNPHSTLANLTIQATGFDPNFYARTLSCSFDVRSSPNRRYIIRVDYPYSFEGGTEAAAGVAGIIYETTISSDRFVIWIDPNANVDSSWWTNWEAVICVSGGSSDSFVEPLPRTTAQLRTDRLARIQSAFGFPLQTLAQVLRLSRAQLYKWLDPDKDIDLHEESRSRLLLIEDLALKWNSVSKIPLSTVAYEPLPHARNIVALLTRAYLDLDAIETALSLLADRVASIPMTISQNMHDRGFTRRPSYRSLPSDE
jgi:hypothetical protein